jgi:hypothetical protein
MRGENMEFLKKITDRKAFTGLMLMSILSILVGSIVLLITYLILNAVITAIGTISNAALNASMFANIGVINSALTLVGIMLIGAGALGLIYMFSGLGGGIGGGRGKQ